MNPQNPAQTSLLDCLPKEFTDAVEKNTTSSIQPGQVLESAYGSDVAGTAGLTEETGSARRQRDQNYRKALITAKVREEIDDEGVLDGGSVGFLPSHLLGASLPYQEPDKSSLTWNRKRRNGSVQLQAHIYMDWETGEEKSFGIPYGLYPRLILLWITSQVKKTNLRTLSFSLDENGPSFRDFITDNGSKRLSGGSGGMQNLMNQLQRLFTVKLSITDAPNSGEWRTRQMLLVDEASINNVTNISGKKFWALEFTLSEQFYATILASAIPLDLRIVSGLGAATMAIDTYSWLCQQVWLINHRRMRERVYSWLELQELFQGKSSKGKFKENFEKGFRVIQVLWPTLACHSEFSAKGLKITPGIMLTVPPKLALTQ